jgi:phage terminase large subunit-like protein
VKIEALARLPRRQRLAFMATLSPDELAALGDQLHDWERFWARRAQRWPRGEWNVWVVLAGRGFGKTRTGAEQINRRAREVPGAHMAIVARTAPDARDTMIEGSSGILAAASPYFRPKYEPSKRRIVWPNSSWATVYTADEPDLLRGPNIGFAWCDELAAWRYARESWDNLQFTLRDPPDPRVLVTTTPRPIPLLRELIAHPGTVVTRGSTYENRANLAPSFLQMMLQKYEGTRIGRQELWAELLDDVEGALWQRALIEQGRVQLSPALDRIVVAIDPSASSKTTSSEVGIVVAGVKYQQHPNPHHFYVLADGSEILGPDAWGRRALELFDTYRADRIVAEVNHGGEMVEHVVRTVRRDVPYRELRASRGKAVRAEPVVALYEQGRVHHVNHAPQMGEVILAGDWTLKAFPGALTKLEDQMCTWTPLDASERSPDRMDALVWAITDLMESTPMVPPSLPPSLTGADRASHWSSAA